jgi:hypothetical protein
MQGMNVFEEPVKPKLSKEQEIDLSRNVGPINTRKPERKLTVAGIKVEKDGLVEKVFRNGDEIKTAADYSQFIEKN